MENETKFEKMQIAIQSSLLASSDTVLNKVIENFVNIELDRRVKMVITAYEKMENFLSSSKKIKPDVSNFTEDGTESLSYSKAKWEEKKKLEKNINDLKIAIDNAINNHDYEKLNKQLNVG